MGWTNSHLYAFQIGGVSWGELDPDEVWDDPLEARKGRLNAVLADAGRKAFSYLYDFGDGWSHTIKLEKIAPGLEGDPNLILLEALGRCPPEDCGGVGGYETLLEILADPDHEAYEETLAWCGGPFDPGQPNLPALEAALQRLARRCAPRPRSAAKRRI